MGTIVYQPQMALSFYLNNLLLWKWSFPEELGEEGLCHMYTRAEIMVGGTWVPYKNENPGR